MVQILDTEVQEATVVTKIQERLSFVANNENGIRTNFLFKSLAPITDIVASTGYYKQSDAGYFTKYSEP